mgnify:CR=1 FL=1
MLDRGRPGERAPVFIFDPFFDAVRALHRQHPGFDSVILVLIARIVVRAIADAPIAPPTPILAHSFVNPDNILKMTDAIDVVFYRGGTAEISDFENH